MRTIVLEGADGSGKSTLAKILHEFGYHVLHEGPPPARVKTSEQMFHHYLERLTKEQYQTVVFDRLHLGELVYGPVLRERSLLSATGSALLERYLEAVDAQVVICLPPWRTVLQNWLATQRDQYVGTPQDLRAVWQGFARLLFNQRQNRNYVWFDYTRHRARAFAKSLMTLEGKALPAGCVGSQRPRFMFVGERSNGNWDLPFMSEQNSSGWLHAAIQAAGYLESEIAFANAQDKNGRPHDLEELLDYWRPYQRPLFVALGTVAAAALAEKGVSDHELEHPQYVKRFKTRYEKNYIERLAQIRRSAK